VIEIEQDGEGVSFTGDLSSDDESFTDGAHGFHVHAVGNVFPDCSAAGGHFKGTPDQIHGFPYYSAPDRHTGDLGNITVTGGASRVDITDSIVSLVKGSNNDITNKAIVIHALPDDGNPNRENSSTGAAGARIGCCLIETSTAN
jgi:Cu/Zn superoxide dismutase